MGFHTRIDSGRRAVKLFAPPYVPGSGLPPGAAFARALEAAQTAADGTISYVAAGQLRESHFVGGVRTLLLEPSATNLVPANLSSAGWLSFSQSSDTLNESAGVDGVANARRIAGSGADAQIYRQPVFAIGDYAASYYAMSIAAGNSLRVGMYGNPNTNDYSSPSFPGAFGLLVGTWTRLVWARNAPTGLAQMGTRARGGGFTSADCRVCMFQLEAGLVATSPIRAGAARPADALSFPVSGTLYEKYYDVAGNLVDSVRPYVANSSIAPAQPRAYVGIKLGLGSFTLARMRAAGGV